MATSNVTYYALGANTWTKIGSNVTGNVTFQVTGQRPAVINFSNDGSAPANNIGPGFVYDRFQGELQQSLSVMTLLDGANTIFARSMTSNTAIIVEM